MRRIAAVAAVVWLLAGTACLQAKPAQPLPPPEAAKVQRLFEFVGAFERQRRTHPELTASFVAEPPSWRVPAGSWEGDEKAGGPAAMKLIAELQHKMSQLDLVVRLAHGEGGTAAMRRAAVRSGVLRLLKAYPLLRYQMYCTSAQAAECGVPNDFFVQFLSRWSLLLLAQSLDASVSDAEWQLIGEVAFPATANGRAAFRLLRKHRVLLLGVDLLPLPSGGGETDWFQNGQLEAVEGLLDACPPPLLHDPTGTQVTTITAHCGEYLGQFEAYTKRFVPRCVDPRAGLGYLSGCSLNIFGGPLGSPAADVGMRSFRCDADAALRGGIRASAFLECLAHETMHLVDYVAQKQNPGLGKRLRGLLALGAAEHSCIRDIDQNATNFAGSGQPGWEWFQAAPQEYMASGANVLFVDPECVMDWAVSLARSKGKIGPLNYLLLLMDMLSLDASYRVTDQSMLVTMQPTGSRFRRLGVGLTRDGDGRIVSAACGARSLRVRYGDDGWARLSSYQGSADDAAAGAATVLVDGVHGRANPDVTTYLSGYRQQVCERALSPELLSGVKVVCLCYDGAPIPPDDAAVIQQYVAKGGGLYIQALGWYLAAYKHLPPDTSPLNALCLPFGLRFNADAAGGEQAVKDAALPCGSGYLYTRQSMPEREVLGRTETVYTWGQLSSLKLSPPAFPLVGCAPAPDANAIVAASRYGEGRVVAMQASGFFDASLWHDGAPVGNRTLLADIFAWLSGR